MKTKSREASKEKNQTDATVAASSGPAARAEAIKLGIDVHGDKYVVVRQIDGAAPQPAQSFTPAEFVAWAARQLTLAEHVYSCYEAGPF